MAEKIKDLLCQSSYQGYVATLPERDCQRGLKNASRRKFKRNTKFLGIKSDSDDRRDH